MANEIEKLVDIIRDDSKIINNIHSARVSRIDKDGSVWVFINGSDRETPTTSSSSEVKKGDVVNVEWRNNKLYIKGNYSDPSAGSNRVSAAESAANHAVLDARRANTAAAAAQGSADAAASSAASAATAAANAWDRAGDAADAAAAADAKAVAAGTAASVAQSSANAAQADATRANTAANNALTQLSTVQDVVGVVEWAAAHSEEDMASYINSHLSLTTYGLNLTLDNTGYRIHIGTYTATGENGVYVIDESGNVVTFFGEDIRLSSDRPQYIGGDDAYIIFYDSDNDGKPDSISIGGSKVTIGSNKKLSDVLTSLDISTRQTASGAEITVAGKTVSLTNGDDGEDGVVLRIDSSKGTVFKNNQVSTVLTVTVYAGSDRITNITDLRRRFGAGAYLQWYWQKIDESDYGVIVASDHKLSNDGFSLTLTPEEVDVKVTFRCELIV